MNEVTLLNDKLKAHANCAAAFLVFGHIAMIADMLDQTLIGFQADTSSAMPIKHDH